MLAFSQRRTFVNHKEGWDDMSETNDQIRIVQESVAGKEITFAHVIGGLLHIDGGDTDRRAVVLHPVVTHRLDLAPGGFGLE